MPQSESVMALVIYGDRNKFRKERDDLFWRGIPGGGHQEEC